MMCLNDMILHYFKYIDFFLPQSALAVMQFYSDRRPEWADLSHTLSPDQYASVSSPYWLFAPPPWCMNLIVKFSFIAKSAKANFVHLTHCQWAAFICKLRDNACTLRTFTVIFGNWLVCIPCAFMHLKKSKAFSRFFCFWDLKYVVETLYTM